jgi:uncharacterized protein
MPDARAEPHYTGSAAIESYGQGGFRFAGMSHRGSLLCLPSGIWAWPAASAAEIDEAALGRVLAEAAKIDVLLIGAGAAAWVMPEALRWRIRDHGIGVDVMATGPAVRTYNIMLGENRRVAAALIAVA